MCKFLPYLLAILVSCFLYCCTNKQSAKSRQSTWVEYLKTIPFPDSLASQSTINIYIKYKQIINGYEISAHWKPFDRETETGPVLINFRDTSTGKNIHHLIACYQSPDTDKITYAKDFKGHVDSIYYFDYTLPQVFLEDSLLGYETPFRFLDIDFDGEKELIINNWDKRKGGNTYNSYDIIGDKLVPLDYLPIKEIANNDIIDTLNQTITIRTWSGCCYYTFFYYTKRERPVSLKHNVKLHESTSEIDEYKLQPNNLFSMDSIHELYYDTVFVYNLTGDSVTIKKIFHKD